MSYIEIIAGPGVGKTSLSMLYTAHTGFRHAKKLNKNSFSDKAHLANLTKWFEYGMSNALVHYHAICQALSTEGDVICDFPSILDRAYALTYFEVGACNADELKAYLELDHFLRKQTPKADLYIHLKCSSGEQMRRIQKRGRLHEENTHMRFLKALSENTEHCLNDLAKGTKILTIDAERYNYVSNPEHQREIISQIMSAIGRPVPSLRFSFNPDTNVRRRPALVQAPGAATALTP